MRKGLGGRGWEGVGAEKRKRQKGETGRSWQGGEAEGRERKKDRQKGKLCGSGDFLRGEAQRQAWGQTGLPCNHPGWIPQRQAL